MWENQLKVSKMEQDLAATRSLKAKQSNRELTAVLFILLTQSPNSCDPQCDTE
ncbi:hypothetical protein Nmel_001963 [Mimus melanotis]